ncbi:hypothetical protein WMY93_033140 [Mugilogobius chulae]|uniref:Zinc finger protein 513 n=1 Tax=Mugilogobius chulae TaxID=88201 RepID=A0AAW0MIR2_9GOBI
MPRRKQSNPQPVKLGVQPPDAPLVVDPSCLVLDSDFLLSGDLEFGDSEIMGLDRDSVTVFSLSVEEDSSVPSDPSLSFCSCKHCGKLLPDSLLSTGIDLGVGLDLTSDSCCLSCEQNLQSPLSPSKSPKPAKNCHTAKLFSCALCSFTSRYSNHLKRHTRIHEGQKPFRCAVCSYASTQLVNLQRHLRTHTGEKPYACDQCEYACSSRGNLRRHQRTHATEQRKKKKNNKMSGAAVEKREKKKRGGRERKKRQRKSLSLVLLSLGSGVVFSSSCSALPVLCRICGQTLEEEDMQQNDKSTQTQRTGLPSLLLRLLPSHASPASKTLQIQTLPLLPLPLLLSLPLPLNPPPSDSRPDQVHRCPHCPYASSHLDNLKRHLRVHTGEKPFTCSTCSYACGNLANLKRHERVHTGAKPFHCPVCGYSCNQSMNLKRHMLRHTGHKPYECGECGYTTGHWDNYKRHQRKHGHNTDNWDKQTYKSKTETQKMVENEDVEAKENSSLQMG